MGRLATHTRDRRARIISDPKKKLLVNFVHNFVSQKNKYTMILQVWTSILISMKMKSLVSALF